MIDRNAKSDAMALAYLLGEMARSLRTEETAFPELASHGFVVLKELLETLTQEGRHEQSF